MVRRHLARARITCGAALVATLLLVSGGAARAEPTTSEADMLFAEGRRLMSQGALAEACPKLEKSFQLAPRLGTMLNLGSCFERRGQFARALALYERAVTLGREQGRPDREAAAREFAVAVEPKVGRLLVVVEEPSTELVVQLDGEALSMRAGLVPVDPGHRRFTARAPGKLSFETTLEPRAGATTTITVPRLRDVPPVAVVIAPTPGEPSSWRTVGAVAGFGVAAVGLGVGTIFGLRAKSKNDSANAECDAVGCSARGEDLIGEARSAGNVSTAAFVVGGVALAATIAVLLVTSNGEAPPTATRKTALATF